MHDENFFEWSRGGEWHSTAASDNMGMRDYYVHQLVRFTDRYTDTRTDRQTNRKTDIKNEQTIIEIGIFTNN